MYQLLFCTGPHPGFFQGLKQVLKLSLGTVRRGGKPGSVCDTLAWSATGVKLWVKEGPCLMEGKRSQKEEELEFAPQTSENSRVELVWVGLVDSHMETELLE